MKAFFQWCAGLVVASMALALLVCGSMMSISMGGMYESEATRACAAHGCTPMPQDCLLSCLAGADELEVRTLLSIVVLVVVTVAIVFVPALQVSPEFVRISAPPWRQHRLFAFRE